MGAGIGTSLQCVWCCVTAQSWHATLALEFEPCGEAERRECHCLAAGSRLYVPSQVPLSLHPRSKKAPVLKKAMWHHCSILLSPIFFYVGPQLCKLCAVRVVRPCFVWMPVHSRHIRLLFPAAVSPASCRLHVFSLLFVTLSRLSLHPFSVSSRCAQTLVQSCYLFVPHHFEAAVAVVLSSLLMGCRPT